MGEKLAGFIPQYKPQICEILARLDEGITNVHALQSGKITVLVTGDYRDSE